MSGESIMLSIRLRLAVDFLHVMYIKDKYIMVFNFIFDLPCRGWSSSVSYVAFIGFLELKCVEKNGIRLIHECNGFKLPHCREGI